MSALIRLPRGVRGVAILEFTLVALPLILAGLTILELGRWHLARTLLSYALLEAGRGAQNGDFRQQALAERFEQAVLPLWPTPQAQDNTAVALRSLRQTAHGFQQRYGFPLWQIKPISPTPHHVPVPGLVLELTWWHRPWVPGMQALLRQLGHVPPSSTLRQGMARSGWLPIRQRIALEWHLLPEQPGSGPSPLLPLITPTAPTPLPGPPLLPWQLHETGVGSGFRLLCRGDNCPAIAQSPAHPVTPEPVNPADPNDPELCGVVLCCTLSGPVAGQT